MFFPSTFVCQGFSFNTSSTDNPVTKAFELDPPRVEWGGGGGGGGGGGAPPPPHNLQLTYSR